tara:strand:- start:1342 stop:1647 length:306 start_codon:yes stop_codon:yes gene_type:complete
MLPRYTEEARKANKSILKLLHNFAERKNATPAQISLALVIAQKPWIVPIPGTTKIYRLEENLGAALVELTVEELQEIKSASKQIQIMGERYTEKIEKSTGL